MPARSGVCSLFVLLAGGNTNPGFSFPFSLMALEPFPLLFQPPLQGSGNSSCTLHTCCREGVTCTTHLLSTPAEGKSGGQLSPFPWNNSATRAALFPGKPKGQRGGLAGSTRFHRQHPSENSQICKPIKPNQTQSSSGSKSNTVIMFILLN